MNRFTPRTRIQRVVLSLAAGLGGLAVGYLTARAIGAAPVLVILAGVALWLGGALAPKQSGKSAADKDPSSGVETLASL